MVMLEMGIPKHKAEQALTETGNMGVEVATEWLFSSQEAVQAPPPDSQQPHHPHTSDTGEFCTASWGKYAHCQDM
jgi:uncharacterized UBP type Zn finger protein